MGRIYVVTQPLQCRGHLECPLECPLQSIPIINKPVDNWELLRGHSSGKFSWPLKTPYILNLSGIPQHTILPWIATKVANQDWLKQSCVLLWHMHSCPHRSLFSENCIYSHCFCPHFVSGRFCVIGLSSLRTKSQSIMYNNLTNFNKAVCLLDTQVLVLLSNLVLLPLHWHPSLLL